MIEKTFNNVYYFQAYFGDAFGVSFGSPGCSKHQFYLSETHFQKAPVSRTCSQIASQWAPKREAKEVQMLTQKHIQTRCLIRSPAGKLLEASSDKKRGRRRNKKHEADPRKTNKKYRSRGFRFLSKCFVNIIAGCTFFMRLTLWPPWVVKKIICSSKK